MKNCKRLSCLIAAVLLCLMLVCPAYAVDSSVPELTDEELYNLEYEKLLISGMDDQAALLSLDDTENSDRYWSVYPQVWNNGIIFGKGYSNAVQVTSGQVSWQGNGRYTLQKQILSSNWSDIYMRVYAGSYLDWYIKSSFAKSATDTLQIVGTIQGYLQTSDDVAAYNTAPLTGQYVLNAYPQRIGLIVNGDLVNSWSAVDSTGTFVIEEEVELTTAVTSIGYRFYFDNPSPPYGFESNRTNQSCGFHLYINDDGIVEYVKSPEYLPVLSEIKETITAVPQTIYNFFFGDSGGEAAGGFKSEVDSAVSSVDQVQQEIVEGLDKPEPDTIVPDLEEVVPQEDYTVYTDIFAPVMQSSLFTSMMLVVVSMAFVSYVLFGKKG